VNVKIDIICINICNVIMFNDKMLKMTI